MRQLRTAGAGHLRDHLPLSSPASRWVFEPACSMDMLTAVEMRVLFKTSIIGTLILMFTYGIFIPNKWSVRPWSSCPWRWHRWSLPCS